MAIAPARPATPTRATLRLTLDGPEIGGKTQTTAAASNPPIPVPPTLIGHDVVAFTLEPGQSKLFGFANLPTRTVGANPLIPQPTNNQSLAIVGLNQLLFTAHAQNANAFVQVETQAIDDNGTIYPGPFLAAATFQSFQVRLTAPASGPSVSGLVVGTLVLAPSS